jgi:GNAT superfamily N-acetyltransferase
MTTGPSIAREIVEAATGHVLRPATIDDLPSCARVWRESLNDYTGRLNLPETPEDPRPILRLYGHLHSTDPAGFVVAERRDAGGSTQIEGFVVALVREGLWFLSMLFVLPRVQGRGLGRALLGAVLAPDGAGDGADAEPGRWHATATDTAQPISNGLYAALGMVPRLPLLRLVGLPERPDALPELPRGIDVAAFEEIDAAGDGLGSSALAAELAALDRDTLGVAHAVDHAYIAGEGRRGFLYHDPTGTAVGYGYTAESGRVGPIAVSDSRLLGGVVRHLVTAVRPRGAFGLWVAGSAGEAMVPLLRAGFRFDGLPLLVCWDRPFADFTRYIPNSPGLL